MTTLSKELDELRNNICHDCKRRLVTGIVLAPAPSTTAAPFTSAFGRRMFQGGQRPIDAAGAGGTSSNSEMLSPIPNSTSETTFNTTVDAPGTNSGSKQTPISLKLESKLPEFSVVYNPEGKRALDLRLAHVFTQKCSALCVKMSPDGQRIAVGSEKTFIHEVKTRSNIR